MRTKKRLLAVMQTRSFAEHSRRPTTLGLLSLFSLKRHGTFTIAHLVVRTSAESSNLA